jgi:uncharacterized membrane protein
VCRLNSPEVNDKVGTNTETNKTNTYTNKRKNKATCDNSIQLCIYELTHYVTTTTTASMMMTIIIIIIILIKIITKNFNMKHLRPYICINLAMTSYPV